MNVKMRLTRFVAGLLLISGLAVLANDAKPILSNILSNILSEGFRSHQPLTTIGDVWIAIQPNRLVVSQEAIISYSELPVAKSFISAVTHMPVAFFIIFLGVLMLFPWLRKTTNTTRNHLINKTSAPDNNPPDSAAQHDPLNSKVPKGIIRPKISGANREFLPAALEIIETPASPILVAMLWFVCLAFTSALTWSYFGRLDIYAVASGKIQPSGRSKVVQPFEAGKVVAVLVENGSRVGAGDVLVELDPTETSADREVQSRELEATSAEVARRTTAIAIARSAALLKTPTPFDAAASVVVRHREEAMLSAHIAQLASALKTLNAQQSEVVARHDRVTMTIRARTKLISVLKERVDVRDALDAQGQGYRAKVIDALQEYEREQTNLAGDQGQLIEFVANKRSIELQIEETLAQFIREQTDKLGEAERKKDRLAQELIKATTKNERTRLTAPISGVVQQLAVTTIGQVVTGGQALMTIVPQDASVEIEAMILNSDIGFVEVGQPVTIKVDAFPFTRYGTLEGAIANISSDGVDQKTSTNLSDTASLTKPQGASTNSSTPTAQTLAYPAKVSLSRQTIMVDAKEVRLLPGMAVTVEVKTGQRRAIDYVLSPLREIEAASLKER